MIPILGRTDGTRLGIDERGELLRVLVGHIAGIEIRHRASDHAGERVSTDALRRAVIKIVAALTRGQGEPNMPVSRQSVTDLSTGVLS
jgi:hypothetical protein